jgi:hypothetical protein
MLPAIFFSLESGVNSTPVGFRAWMKTVFSDSDFGAENTTAVTAAFL